VTADAKPARRPRSLHDARQAAEQACEERSEWLRNAPQGAAAMIPESAQRKLAVLVQAASDAMALAQAAKRQTGDVEYRLQLLINSKADESTLAKASAAIEAARDLQQARYRAYEERE
jgi:hypothetical protein